MSNKSYVPRPVFDTMDEVLEQYKAYYDAEDKVLLQILDRVFKI